jgi:L-iditol 2-dehydrogenase
MENFMKAWVLYSAYDMRLEKRPVPVPKKGEALIKIKSVGICGSDVHFYKNGMIGDFIIKEPMILGHECSGEVVEVNDDRGILAIGDRVVIEPGVPCGKCEMCRLGRYNMCEDVFFMATPPDDGCFCEYVAWPIEYLYIMPEQMNYEMGALIEPFTCGLGAAKRSGVDYGDDCVILGAGPIGIMVAKALRVKGAGRIFISDVQDYRLEIAKAAGVTYPVNVLKGNLLDVVMRETNGKKAMFAFETAGSPKTYADLVNYVRPGGTIVMQGMLQTYEIAMPMLRIVTHEINMISVFRYCNVYEQAIKLVADGRVELLSVITHRKGFDEIKKSFDMIVEGKEQTLKVMINF